MANFAIEFTEHQMISYYKYNNLPIKKEKKIEVFINTTKKEILKRSKEVRCGIERVVTNFGENPELLNIRNATKNEIKQHLKEVERITHLYEIMESKYEDCIDEIKQMKHNELKMTGNISSYAI